MNSKEIRGLIEAYAEVYAPQKEIEEAVKGTDTEMRRAASAERRAGDKPLPAKEGEKFAKFKASQISYIDKKTKGKYIPGMTREEVDIFDVVLEFLQAEGYAETLEEAEWMMANVIDEEAIDIILGEGIPLRGTTPDGKPWRVNPNQLNQLTKMKMEKNPKEKERSSSSKKERYEEVGYVDEAQAARENPEKYEREQSKKYAPVRGERTPMPPRGDKRREDFEKWYAKNVR